MIDVFISRRECFKPLSAGIYLENGILRPNAQHTQTNPSLVGRRPEFSPFALSVSLKDGAGPKTAARDWEEQGLFAMGKWDWGWVSTPFVATYIVKIFLLSAPLEVKVERAPFFFSFSESEKYKWGNFSDFSCFNVSNKWLLKVLITVSVGKGVDLVYPAALVGAFMHICLCNEVFAL